MLILKQRIARKKKLRKIRRKAKRLLVKVKKVKEHWKERIYFPSVFCVQYMQKVECKNNDKKKTRNKR